MARGFHHLGAATARPPRHPLYRRRRGRAVSHLEQAAGETLARYARRGDPRLERGWQRRRDRRWIVKSVWEHASIGIDDHAIVSGGDTIRARIAQQRERYGGTWFAERFVDGREYNIALLEDATGARILPVAEIDFSAFPDGKPRIVNYAAKWDSEAFEYHHTPRRFIQAGAETALDNTLQVLGRACWQLFGLRGYARVDIRIDTRGEPQVLEINTNPCLSPDAGFAAAAAEAGLDFTDLIGHIVARVRLPDSTTAPARTKSLHWADSPRRYPCS